MKSKEVRDADKQAKKDERKKLRYPTLAFVPYTWVPPVVEKHLDRKGREVVTIKQRGHYKATHKPGTIIEIGKTTYKVSKTGGLIREGMEPRAARRAKRLAK